MSALCFVKSQIDFLQTVSIFVLSGCSMMGVTIHIQNIYYYNLYHLTTTFIFYSCIIAFFIIVNNTIFCRYQTYFHINHQMVLVSIPDLIFQVFLLFYKFYFVIFHWMYTFMASIKCITLSDLIVEQNCERLQNSFYIYNFNNSRG